MMVGTTRGLIRSGITATACIGPWIENLDSMLNSPFLRSSMHVVVRRKLRDIFGPFIPIFLLLTDLWEPNGKRALPPDLMPALLRVLRPTVPYITVLQHDLGLPLAPCDFSLEDCDGGEEAERPHQ